MDGLRGLAILWVMLFHVTGRSGRAILGPLEFYGWTGMLGVDLFFVISGFCLFYPYARAKFEKRVAPTLWTFFYRRFIKIVPSYYLILFVLGIVHRKDLNAFELHDFFMHVVFLHAFSIETVQSISGPLWSLGVEVPFYVIFPLAAYALLRWPIATVGSMWMTAIAFRLYAGVHVFSGSYDFMSWDWWISQLPEYLDEFCGGMLVAYLFVWLEARHNGIRRYAGLMSVVAASAFGILSIGLYRLYLIANPGNPTNPTPHIFSWLNRNRAGIALSILAIVLSLLLSEERLRRAVANPVLVFLSVISYNLYLWHDVVVDWCGTHGWPCSLTPLPWLHDPNWGLNYFVISICTSVALATAITYAFERPLLGMAKRHRDSAATPPKT